MAPITHVVRAALTAALLAPVAGGAQSLGEAEYMNSCAQCHGAGGKGDGVIAGYLTSPPPDLTVLQQNNDGVFPVSDVYSLIEGTAAEGVHGTSDMPAWGQRYLRRGREMQNPDAIGDQAGVFARARILALIEHLASIQE